MLQQAGLHVSGLASLDLGEFKPKPTRITEDQVEASLVLWKSADEKVLIGVWECSPGTFRATREGYDEVANLLSGRVTLVSEDGERSEHGPGDLVVTNAGWRGTWEVHETVRKVFTIYRHA